MLLIFRKYLKQRKYYVKLFNLLRVATSHPTYIYNE